MRTMSTLVSPEPNASRARTKYPSRHVRAKLKLLSGGIRNSIEGPEAQSSLPDSDIVAPAFLPHIVPNWGAASACTTSTNSRANVDLLA